MKRVLILTLFIFWALLLLAGYYVFHKPFSGIQPLLSILQAILDILLAASILCVTGGLGWYLLRRWPVQGLAALALQSALGTGAASLVWLLLGVLGLYKTWLAYALLVASILLLRKGIMGWLSNLKELIEIWVSAGVFERIFFVISACLVINQLWFALAPPVKYDALTYHLALPHLYLARGSLVFEPNIPYWGHPQLAEMLYTWAMALRAPQTAAVVAWLVGLVFLLGTAGLTRTIVDQSNDPLLASRSGLAAALAVMAVLAGATARGMLGWAYTDLFSALMGLAVLAACAFWFQTGRESWFRWAGVCVGLAVSTKYTSGVIVLALFPAALILHEQKRLSWKVWLQSGLISLAVFLPWAVKNMAATGNPLFPYVLPTTYYSAERLAAANLPPESVNWLVQLALPVSFTWTGVENAAGPGTDLGPLLVLFAVPGLLAFRRSPFVRLASAVLIVAWLVIALGGARFGHLQQPRVFFVVLPALAIAAGIGWLYVQSLSAAGIRLRRMAGVLALIVACLALWQDSLGLLESGALPTVFGLQSDQAYLEDHTGVYIDAMHSLEGLPTGSRVLMLWEGRTLYAPDGVTPDPWIDRWRTARMASGSPQTVLEGWRKEGFTHLLLYRAGEELMRKDDRLLTAADWAAFDDLLASLPPPQNLPGNFYAIYALK